MRRLLPFLDHLELAMEKSKNVHDASKIIEGIKLIHGEFIKILNDEGLKEIEALSEKFDPKIHEAVDVTDGGDPGVISEVLQKGYYYKDKLLRAARVKVVK